MQPICITVAPSHGVFVPAPDENRILLTLLPSFQLKDRNGSR